LQLQFLQDFQAGEHVQRQIRKAISIQQELFQPSERGELVRPQTQEIQAQVEQ